MQREKGPPMTLGNMRAQPCPSWLRLFFAVHRIKKPKLSGRDRRTLLELILVLSLKYWQELL
jgi:hypothetical protein